MKFDRLQTFLDKEVSNKDWNDFYISEETKKKLLKSLNSSKN